MIDKEKIIPGCGNCNSLTGVCNIMFEDGARLPSLAKETLIDPPNLLEGPPSHGVQAFVCTAASEPVLQENCSRFVVRTAAEDLRDEDI